MFEFYLIKTYLADAKKAVYNLVLKHFNSRDIATRKEMTPQGTTVYSVPRLKTFSKKETYLKSKQVERAEQYLSLFVIVFNQLFIGDYHPHCCV